MPGLTATLDVALHSLLTQQGALRATTDNISNISTPGYSRRRPVIVEERPAYDGSVLVGRGASLQTIESVRDRILELRIYNEQQRQSATESFVSSMSAVESLFNDSAGSLGNAAQAFFNSLVRLSTTPQDVAQRQNVLAAANNLAQAFNSYSARLQEQQQQIDQSIVQDVAEVNRLTTEIARVNQQVAQQATLGQDAGALEDQRNQLIRELSKLIDVSVTDSSDGYTLTTTGGAPLVVSGIAYQLVASIDGTPGLHRIYASETDITGKISAGSLGGNLQVRDEINAGLLRKLDDFAFNFAQSVNAAHQQGFDLDGVAGTAIFSQAAGPTGAAAALRVLIADPRQLAASSDGSVGDNGNLLRMAAVRDAAILDGQTPTGLYARMVFEVGATLANAKDDSEAGSLVLRQLDELRGSISGVSLDEEAANLVQLQRSYEACARLIQTINELMETVVHLGE